MSTQSAWRVLKSLAEGNAGRRKHSLPVEVISPRPTPKAVLSPRHARADPWVDLWQALDRQQEEFAKLEQQLVAAAHRDGLDDDGPMTPTLAALRLSMRSLNENSLLIGRMLRHYMGEVLDALEAAKEVSDAEATRLRVEVQHSAAGQFYRIQAATAAKDPSGSAGLSWLAMMGLGCALAAVIVCAFVAGSRYGYGSGYGEGRGEADSTIRQTEWHLKAAFAHGGTAASLWALLMESNDIEKAIGACHGPNLMKLSTLRQACWVPLWIEPDTTVPVPEPTPQGSVSVPIPPSPSHGRQQHGSAAPVQPFGAFGYKLLPTPPTGMVNFGPDDSQ